MMKKIIEEILNLAVNAPSGHNSQPWSFIFNEKERSLLIYNLPNKDKTLFNYKQRGSLVAIGSLIENIAIIASNKKLKADISLFPEGENSNLIAKLIFEVSDKNYQYDYLLPFNLKRTTNRKSYRKTQLTLKDKQKIDSFLQSLENSRNKILLLTDKEKIEIAANLFSLGDRLLFENYYLHKGLFDNVNWTLEEEQKKREGLYIKTKELSFFQEIVFKYILSKWHILNKLNKAAKFSTIIAMKRAKLYQHCSAIGLITASIDSPEAFVLAGRLLQRWWLFTTSLNLSFQPVSVGLLYVGQWLEIEDITFFTPQQKNNIKNTYKKIKEFFNIKELTPIFSFRIGYSERPTVSSLKRPPEIIFE